ncbi:MAG: hypothetical protein H0T46_32250 [Deltaproteobacteria bacterium]|nr:hypothetical protein [Deltaproteobacteria bacterium]
MAYRDDAGDGLEAPTADGTLSAELAPHAIKLSVGSRTLHIADKFATVIEHHKRRASRDHRVSLKIEGCLVVARDVPHEDLGVWIEVDPKVPARVGMRRIFGVEPVNLMEPGGLSALASLDRLAARLRTELAQHAGKIRRAIEIGRGLDKVLVADHGDRFVVYARRLFRDRARFAMSIHDDGRIVIPAKKGTAEITVKSQHGVTVWGDYIRFADPHGTDLAKVSIPWIEPEDRNELARRIGQLVNR